MKLVIEISLDGAKDDTMFVGQALIGAIEQIARMTPPGQSFSKFCMDENEESPPHGYIIAEARGAETGDVDIRMAIKDMKIDRDRRMTAAHSTETRQEMKILKKDE